MTRSPLPAAQAILITGGAGFVGTNLAHRLLCAGERVVLLDNLAREGVEANAAWLHREHGEQVRLVIADVRDRSALAALLPEAKAVFHFAAQVAVTTSLADPVRDFEVNAGGTLALLEALRQHGQPLPLVFTSTNKVYGALPWLELECPGPRYLPRDAQVAARGLDESAPLDFHSPYGCSKGAADQYVLDYARTFGMPNVVFRMSCIYGPHQFGNEDQGWVAHFLIRALAGQPITLYGDGCQVRDLLFVHDLVDALRLASAQAPQLAGQAFNMGGGPAQAASLHEVLALIAEHTGGPLDLRHEAWRPGDQRYYVADSRKFQDATGWQPRVTVAEGVALLAEWLAEHHPALAGRKGARLEVAG